MGNVLVSVALRAYNQENEIKKALDSILMQKCNFDIEIVLGVDLSTDNTTKVIQSYIDTAPDNIHYTPLFHKHSLGGLANLVSVLEKCTGKYIAWLDGDDYWNDPLKLQKQVNIMEDNPLVGLVYTDDYCESLALNHPVERKHNSPTENIFTQLLLGCFITTETVMFRIELLKFIEFEIMLNNHDSMIDDDFIFLEFSNHTQFYHLKEYTSTATIKSETILDYNLPLSAAKYDSLVVNTKLYFINKYPNNTYLTKIDITDRHFQLWLKAALMCHNKKIAIENLNKIVNKNSYYKVLLYVCKIPLGFNLYILYRKLKGKDNKSLLDRYYF